VRSDNSTETMLSFISLLGIFALVVSGESFPRRTNYVLPQELHRENLRIQPKGRLSTDVIPTDYAIRLKLESDAFEKNVFSGIVDILFDIKEDVSSTHWWSDTFLNDGFATYFEYLATAKVLLVYCHGKLTHPGV
jgi:hypothetical protein